MNTLEALKAGRRAIQDPHDWWPGPGNPIPDYALGQCAVTACPSTDALILLDRVAQDLFADDGYQGDYLGLPEIVNDNFGHIYVLAMYDRAIEIAEARQSEWDVTPLTRKEKVTA